MAGFLSFHPTCNIGNSPIDLTFVTEQIVLCCTDLQ